MRTDVFTARGATGSRRARAISRTTPTSRTACSSFTPRPASCGGFGRRTGSPGSLYVELFVDEENGGFFQSPADGEPLIVRRKIFDDQPAPSGNSMLAYVLLRLSRIYGDDELEEKALSVYKLILGGLQNGPSSFGWALVGVDLYLSPRREIAIAGPADSEVAKKALRRFEPHAVIAFGPADDIPLLEGKTLVDGKPAVYVCERFTCLAPATDPRDLR